MQVRTINNIATINTLKNTQYKKECSKTVEYPSCVHYSAENAKANFMPVSFKANSSLMDDFCDYLDETAVAAYIKDDSFKKNPNFDFQGWFNFIDELSEMHENYQNVCVLDYIVQKPEFSEHFNNPDYNPQKALDFIYAYSSTPEMMLPLNDGIEMMHHYATSDYDLDEYVEAIRYFNNIKDINGENIFFSYDALVELSDLVKYMLDIDRGSVEASNFQMLLDLVEKGVIDSNIFKHFSKESTLTKEISDDIDKLYDAYITGKNPIDVFVPTFKTTDEAIAKVQIGDVFEIEGEERIHIKDRNEKPQKLDISKETYFELFPPIGRFSSTQNLIGNCWEVSVFNALFSDPDTRADILSLFHQQGDDINILFPNAGYGKINFENGKIPKNVEAKFYSLGSKGFQMLEYADAKELYTKRLQKLYFQLKNKKGLSTEEKDFVQRYKSGQKNFVDTTDIVIIPNYETGEFDFRKFDEKLDTWGDAVTSSRHMGDSNDLFRRLGYESPRYSISRDDVQKAIVTPAFFDYTTVLWSTKGLNIENPTTKDIIYNKDKGIYASHVYRLLPATIDENNKTTEFYAINPLGATKVKLTMDELVRYGHHIYCAVKEKDED